MLFKVTVQSWRFYLRENRPRSTKICGARNARGKVRIISKITKRREKKWNEGKKIESAGHAILDNTAGIVSLRRWTKRMRDCNVSEKEKRKNSPGALKIRRVSISKIIFRWPLRASFMNGAYGVVNTLAHLFHGEEGISRLFIVLSTM